MKNLFVLLFSLCVAGLPLNDVLLAQQRRSSIPLEHGAHRIGKRTDADMQRWRAYGLGQFIHWGVYAIPGGFWEGKYYGGAAEWIRSWEDMPKEAYDNLYKTFNPTAFDAAAWAKQAKEMGVKYLVFTTKHHDGFCLWPSKYTDYTIANTPYQRDIVKEIVDAYQAEGIDVYLYFSIIDWNHSGYRSKAPTNKQERSAYEEFKRFTANQLRELLTNYPTVRGLWFDGSWDEAWIKEAAWVDSLGMELRAMKPGLIIGSRFRADEHGKRHYDTNGDLIDDYDQTWERDLPKNIADLNGVDWDCVMTVPENQWGYHADWRGYVKNSFDLFEMMANAVSLDGNFVVNFGPDGKGNIRPEETRLAMEIGDWMKVNSEAIYDTGYAGLEKQGWGYYTKKADKIYLIVFNRPINNRLKIVFPREGVTPDKASFLQNGESIGIINGGKNKQNDRIYYLDIPATYTSSQPFVIVLDTRDDLEENAAYQQAKT